MIFWKGRRFHRMIRLFLLLFLLQWGAGRALSRWVQGHLLEILPEESEVGSIRWRWPIGVTVREITLPDPGGQASFLLRVKRAHLDVPVWAVGRRPIPVRMTLRSPHLQLVPGGLDPLIPWVQSGAAQELPLALYSIRVIDGRLDTLKDPAQPTWSVFQTAHIQLEAESRVSFGEPVFNFSGRGDFVSDQGEVIGLQSLTATIYPRTGSGKGTLRLRHERLGDFRDIYQYGPRPIRIDSGLGDTLLTGEMTDGKRVQVTARCLVEKLELTGRVGEVSWRDILRAVEDENGRYEWSVQVEGDLSDPHFDLHDQILREVEFLMKEKAASRGLKIEGSMFFYADTLAGEDLLEDEEEDEEE